MHASQVHSPNRENIGDEADIFLQGADLAGACLDGAKLRGAHLDGADLRGASLECADMLGTGLERAKLTQLPPLRGRQKIFVGASRCAVEGAATVIRDRPRVGL